MVAFFNVVSATDMRYRPLIKVHSPGSFVMGQCRSCPFLAGVDELAYQEKQTFQNFMFFCFTETVWNWALYEA